MLVEKFKDLKITKTAVKKLISGCRQQMDGAKCGSICKEFQGLEVDVFANSDKDFGKWYYYYSVSIGKYNESNQWISFWQADFKEFGEGDEEKLAEKINTVLSHLENDKKKWKNND